MNVHLAAAALTLCAFAMAQENYWVANRTTSDIMRVSAWGSVLDRVPTPTNLRSCFVDPDGKVWIVRFIQPTFDIYDPITATMTTAIPLPSGNAFGIAFDSAGHAWISNGASAVHEFDPSGAFLQTITLSAGAALGITIDANGNKWVAHRVTPASVSRIDALGVPTNFPLGITTMTPGQIIADYRGIGNPSHLWVTGDGAAQVIEVDSATGATLNIYSVPVTSLGPPVFDRTGRIWLSSFANGTILQLDETNGSVLQTLTFPPNNIQMSVDNLGRIRATSRSAAGVPCEVRRIDPVTGALEIPTVLTFGGFNGTGTQAALSTQFQYCLVVDPFGDMDNDGEANFSEIIGGTSPTDLASNSSFSVESFGVTQNGSTPTFDVIAPGTLWIVGFAGALIAPTAIPGFGGNLQLDLTTLVTTTAGVGNGSIPIGIAPNPALAGIEFFAQGVIFDGVGFQFRNLSGMKIW
jgi:streptogramin lyase